MSPLDFIKEASINDANTPAHLIIEALSKPLKIYGELGSHSILSYYYDKDLQQMVIDID